jgi:cupin 2 domain-containing protein
MGLKKGNIFGAVNMPPDGSEFSEILLHHDKFVIERIVSDGQTTPENDWYDQEKDEWVILLQGVARVEFAGSGTVLLEQGDYILIPAHVMHRVTSTSQNPACVWLALHSK